MKPILLSYLPPVFRLVERLGLSLPRRFFTRASQYKRVPPLRKDDNVIPSAQDIPGMISSSLRNRRRAVSVGPLSEADAREFIAYREQKRRDSRSSTDTSRPRPGDLSSPLQNPTSERPKTNGEPLPPFAPEGSLADLPPKNAANPSPPATDEESATIEDEEENRDREMFMALEKPRVRYDVEVVTKLVVYAGIGWLAVEGNPILFEISGLGMGKGAK
ncbi:Long-chain base-1-phosphate phosphatase [Taxawa tesnikishii (nom. ined.)]|nr:Long-chain base-1-phosphate phosphatase [Dothideales sp. JES 119]